MQINGRERHKYGVILITKLGAKVYKEINKVRV